MGAKDNIDIKLSELVEKFKSSLDLEEKLLIGTRFIKLKTKYIHLFQDNISAGVPDYEVWRNCIGWEHLYQISSFGRIKAHEMFFIKNRRGRENQMAVYKEEKIRSWRIDPSGYVRTSFWLEESVKHFFVHRLVAQHFIPNPEGFNQVLHIDDNPGNPHFKNLRWGTQKHNIMDCVEKGRWHIGEKNNKTKLKATDIPKIRSLLSGGKSANSIGPMFGVSKYAILCIGSGKTWKHIK